MYFDRNELYSIQSNIDGERISLYDVASWKNGLAFKNIDFSNNGMPVIKIAELNNGISSSTAFTDKQYSDDVFLTKGDFVFSWSGNPYTSIDIFRYDLPDGWLNQHIFKVVPNEKIIIKDYFFYLMKYIKPNFIKIATNKQTTGLGHVTLNDIKQINFKLPNIDMQYRISKILFCIDKKIAVNNTINKDSLKSIKLNIPSREEILKFEQTASPLDKLIENNYSENLRLTQLRDTLLPKLMSGEIDVSNVDISADKLSFNEK